MTTLELARHFVGIQEREGPESNPVVLRMLQLVDKTVTNDSTSWCSAFVGFIAWMLYLEQTRSLAARSWLFVGDHIELAQALPGDVVILTRGTGTQPPANVMWTDAHGHVTYPLGHVGFLVRYDGTFVWVLAGNQGNAINVAAYPASPRVLGVRRLRPAQ